MSPFLLLLLSWSSLSAAPAPQQEEVRSIEAAQLGKARNVHRSGDLWFSGQFQPEDIEILVEQGIATVLSVRTDGEVDWDEKGKLSAAGIEFLAVPFRTPESLTDDVFERVRTILRDREGPLLFHCGSANRVGGAWLTYRVLDQGVPLEQALPEAKKIGLSFQPYEERALAYIAAQSKEQSVREGINDNFKDPELDVDKYLDRFEVESREVYSARQAVLEACRLQPGMRVADIGAGTGLYTMLFAEAVGAEGWVFAVDISTRFLQHILARAEELDVQNLMAVLCPEKAVGLPPESIDLAFVCDTYHHFEYPRSTLATLRRALVPGGRLIVIDFERIEGVTREWLMDHVRAGKAVFRSEIEAAGFRFVREVDVAGLEENYFLEFEKPRK